MNASHLTWDHARKLYEEDAKQLCSGGLTFGMLPKAVQEVYVRAAEKELAEFAQRVRPAVAVALSLLLTALAAAQEVPREPVRPVHRLAPAYPACGAQAVVGQPCVWQPPNLVISGVTIGEASGDVLPGLPLPVWFFMDTSGFPADYHPSTLGFGFQFDTMIGDCSSRMRNANVAEVTCGSYCNGNYANNDRSPWQCTSSASIRP